MRIIDRLRYLSTTHLERDLYAKSVEVWIQQRNANAAKERIDAEVLQRNVDKLKARMSVLEDERARRWGSWWRRPDKHLRLHSFAPQTWCPEDLP